MVSFQQLKYFVTIIDNGSLNKASKILYVSQPALTKQISQLEQELNISLLKRKATGIELTEAGEFFYQKAVFILNQMDQLLDGIQSFAQTPSLRIGALPSIASYYLPQFLGRWQDIAKPSITIRDTTNELVKMVENEELDFAVVQDYPSSSKLVSLHLTDEPYDAVLPKDHSLTSQAAIPFQEFTDQPLILHKNPCDIRRSFQKVCSDAGITPKSVMDLEFNELIIPYVANRIGLSIVPRMVADNIYDPNVVVRLLHPAPVRAIHAVFQLKKATFVKSLFH